MGETAAARAPTGHEASRCGGGTSATHDGVEDPQPPYPAPAPTPGFQCAVWGRSRQCQRESKLPFFFLSGRNRKGKVKGKLYDSRLAWMVARVNRKLAGEEVGGQG